MKTEFTAGPWELRQRENSGSGFYVEPGIGEVHGVGRCPSANARLIAAAPEMFEALYAAAELMPLGTPKRAEWLRRTSEILGRVVGTP